MAQARAGAQAPSPTQSRHTAEVMRVVFSPDGRYLLTGSWDKTARLWDVGARKLHAVLPGHPNGVIGIGFSPDGRLIATGGGRALKLWDAASGRLLRSGQTEEFIGQLRFSPDGRVLAVASGRAVELWDPQTMQRVGMLPCSTEILNSVMGFEFTRSGTLLATGTEQGGLQVWDFATRKPRFGLTGHTDGIQAVKFSPREDTLLSGSGDGTARLWDLRTGRQLLLINPYQPGEERNGVGDVAFSPDGSLIATGGGTHRTKVWVWETATGRNRYSWHAHLVSGLEFSPDGKLLASGGWDNTGRIWDVATGQQLHLLRGHQALLRDVVFSPDGKTLASISADKTVRLWDVATGQPLAVL